MLHTGPIGWYKKGLILLASWKFTGRSTRVGFSRRGSVQVVQMLRVWEVSVICEEVVHHTSGDWTNRHVKTCLWSDYSRCGRRGYKTGASCCSCVARSAGILQFIRVFTKLLIRAESSKKRLCADFSRRHWRPNGWAEKRTKPVSNDGCDWEVGVVFNCHHWESFQCCKVTTIRNVSHDWLYVNAVKSSIVHFYLWF